MPTAERIVFAVTALANEWRWLAVSWHVALGALLIALASGWRPSPRRLGYLLVLPIMSVSVLAWVSRNPFTGLGFAMLAAVLILAAKRLPVTAVRPGSPGWLVVGAALVAFGWTYPHFLETDTWTAYAYASPLGILPCPTLSVVIGITLMFGALYSARWSVPVFAAGVVYGLIGVFRLRVALDVWLLAGATLLGARGVADLVVARVRATEDERTRRLPGDEFVPAAADTLTHAIRIAGAPGAVWPWLVQMGAGSRAGWYSYDFLDNRRQPSARRIIPELQHITVGTLFPAMPGLTEGFKVLACEPERSLVLGWPKHDGSPMVTWAFVLERRPGGTRLIVRVRAAHGYRFRGLPVWLSTPAIRLVHFAMQRKQLVGIAGRVEGSRAALDGAA